MFFYEWTPGFGAVAASATGHRVSRAQGSAWHVPAPPTSFSSERVENKLTDSEGLSGAAGWGWQFSTTSSAIVFGAEQSLMDSAVTRLRRQMAAAGSSAEAGVTAGDGGVRRGARAGMREARGTGRPGRGARDGPAWPG